MRVLSALFCTIWLHFPVCFPNNSRFHSSTYPFSFLPFAYPLHQPRDNFILPWACLLQIKKYRLMLSLLNSDHFFSGGKNCHSTKPSQLPCSTVRHDLESRFTVMMGRLISGGASADLRNYMCLRMGPPWNLIYNGKRQIATLEVVLYSEMQGS